MKAKGAGKRKGSSFERLISVTISKWISKGEREDLVWRSAMSGGRATVARKKGSKLNKQVGDISAIDPLANNFLDLFYVECKSYSDLQYYGIVSNVGNLMIFWNTTVVEAGYYSKSPLLIAKQNRQPIVVFLDLNGLKLLKLSENDAIIASPFIEMYGYLLSDFVDKAQSP